SKRARRSASGPSPSAGAPEITVRVGSPPVCESTTKTGSTPAAYAPAPRLAMLPLMRKAGFAFVAVALFASSAVAQSNAKLEANKKTVVAFYEAAINQKDFRGRQGRRALGCDPADPGEVGQREYDVLVVLAALDRPCPRPVDGEVDERQVFLGAGG